MQIFGNLSTFSPHGIYIVCYNNSSGFGVFPVGVIRKKYPFFYLVAIKKDKIASN